MTVALPFAVSAAERVTVTLTFRAPSGVRALHLRVRPSACRRQETGGSGQRSTTKRWVTVTLPPGHYELVCNLQNHYANGMRQELVVTG